MTKLVQDHLLTILPVATRKDKVGDVVDRLRYKRHKFDSITYIYVVENHRLKGVFSIKELLRASVNTSIAKIMTRKLVTISPQSPLERAAIRAIENNIKAVPVVNREGEFLGVVGTDAILQILHKGHAEDLLRMGGIQITEQKHVLEIMSDRILRLIKIRLPWLVVGLMGGFVATMVVSSFSQTLSKTVALAFFMPVVLYMSTAVGGQTQSLFIRAITVKKIGLPRYLLKEITVDTILGVLLATLVFLFGFALRRQFDIAFVVAVAMIINVLIAGFVAILIPWTLMRLKKDPAMGSGPFVNVVQDVITLVVYFAVAAALL